MSWQLLVAINSGVLSNKRVIQGTKRPTTTHKCYFTNFVNYFFKCKSINEDFNSPAWIYESVVDRGSLGLTDLQLINFQWVGFQ